MAINRHRYKPIRTDSGESEDIPLDEKRPLGMICKCPPHVLTDLGDRGKLHASHPRFGPFYREGESEVNGKKEAWEKIEKSFPDKEKALETYLSAVRRTEKDARIAYGGDKALCNLTESEFRRMMIDDGCFFLQLALFVLGVSSNQLGYPENHIIFGKKQDKNDVKRWTESMFFPGNQMPLVVLNEFMKESFFRGIIQQMNWEIPPSDLSRRILYEFLILPALESSHEGLGGRALWFKHRQHSDLLHALHSLMLGAGGGIFQDETGEDDLDAGGTSKLEAKDMSFSATVLEKKGIGFGKVEQFGCMKTSFTKKGIRFGKVEHFGCMKISFTNSTLFPCLYLPIFTVDDDTELLWKSLKYYEMTQQLGKGKGKCEVRSYLQFMNDLICTYDDVKLLSKKGIIKLSNDYYKERLPTMLSNLAGSDINTTQNLHLVRTQLRDFNLALWARFKIVAIVVFFLTLIQAFFAVLGYFRPPHQK